MADINEQKNALRVAAAEARRRAHAADVAGRASELVQTHFLAQVPLDTSAVVGGYWPIGDELDVRPLLQALYARGNLCGLPVARRRQPLVFHRWRPDAQLTRGVFGISMPDHSTPVVVPDVLLMPLLAFDARGRRIGYGAGYYDRTIPAIRAQKPVITVGVAYAAQEVDQVPTDQFDQTLDWIVTEIGARRVERRLFPWLRRFFTS